MISSCVYVHNRTATLTLHFAALISTVSTRKRRILHVVADSWEPNGGEFLLSPYPFTPGALTGGVFLFSRPSPLPLGCRTIPLPNGFSWLLGGRRPLRATDLFWIRRAPCPSACRVRWGTPASDRPQKNGSHDVSPCTRVMGVSGHGPGFLACLLLPCLPVLPFSSHVSSLPRPPLSWQALSRQRALPVNVGSDVGARCHTAVDDALSGTAGTDRHSGHDAQGKHPPQNNYPIMTHISYHDEYHPPRDAA